MSTTPAVLVNYYALLGVTRDADEAAIRKAYRRRALELHPDKNPDNPKAEDLFMAIKFASEVLLDKEQRAALDSKLGAQEATQAKFRAMDEHRSKLREQLESREKAAASSSQASTRAASASQAELQRLRRQGREASEAYSASVHAERSSAARSEVGQGQAPTPPTTDFDVAAAVRVRWSAEVSSRMGEERDSEGGLGLGSTLSERQLRRLFKLYGSISLILARKGRSVCLVFSGVEAAEAAVAVPPDGFRITRLLQERSEEEGEGEAGVGVFIPARAGQKRERGNIELDRPVPHGHGPVHLQGIEVLTGPPVTGLGQKLNMAHSPSRKSLQAQEEATLAMMLRLASTNS